MTGPSDRGSGRRMSWVVAAQGASSASNLALGLAAAHLLDGREYGVFAVVFTIYALVLGVSRGLVAEPSVIAGGHDVAEASGAAVLVGLAAGAPLVVVGLVVGGPAGTGLALLGAAMVPLLAQDVGRFGRFARLSPAGAFVLDVVWLGVTLAALVVARAAGPVDLAALLACWAAGAAVAALLGFRLNGAAPRLRHGGRWLRRNASAGGRFAGEFLLVYGCPQLTLFAVAAAGGYAEAGAFRGAGVLLGPAALTGVGLATALQPEVVRLHRQQRSTRGPVLRLVTLTASGALAWTAVVAVAPDRLGSLVLGDVWEVAHEIAVPLGLTIAATAASAVLVSALHAFGEASRSIRTSAVGALAMLAGGVGGAVLAGGRGAAWGMIVPAWFGFALLVQVARRAGPLSRRGQATADRLDGRRGSPAPTAVGPIASGPQSGGW